MPRRKARATPSPVPPCSPEEARPSVESRRRGALRRIGAETRRRGDSPGAAGVRDGPQAVKAFVLGAISVALRERLIERARSGESATRARSTSCRTSTTTPTERESATSSSTGGGGQKAAPYEVHKVILEGPGIHRRTGDPGARERRRGVTAGEIGDRLDHLRPFYGRTHGE